MPAFVPRLQLAAATYHDAVRPILAALFPGPTQSAALLGPGSGTLGYDGKLPGTLGSFASAA